MPASKSASIRYRIIDHCLTGRQSRYPSLEKLAEICSDKLNKNISTSTIEKDIASMKQSPPQGFGAPIIYNKLQRGYQYAEEGFSITELSLQQEEWDALRYAAKLLYQYADVPMFRDFKSAIERIDARFNLQLDPGDPFLTKYIQFETGNSTTGYQWLSSVYPAVRNSWPITITYENIYKNELRQYEVQPYLLKEQHNRWYLIGWVDQRNDYLTFALDRIQSMQVIEQRKRLRTDFDPELFLKNSVGIMEGDGKAYKIMLTINAPFHKLVKLEPLHASQQVVKETPQYIKLQLSVNINPELCSKILSMGPACTILQPAVLKEQVKTLLKHTLVRYR